MAEEERSLDEVEDCLESLGISSLGGWDVLVYLFRHHAILASVERIARLVGYPSEVAGEALDTLESLGLVHRSRDSEGLRLYQFVAPPTQRPPPSGFWELMSLAESRKGRLIIIEGLRLKGKGA